MRNEKEKKKRDRRWEWNSTICTSFHNFFLKKKRDILYKFHKKIFHIEGGLNFTKIKEKMIERSDSKFFYCLIVQWNLKCHGVIKSTINCKFSLNWPTFYGHWAIGIEGKTKVRTWSDLSQKNEILSNICSESLRKKRVYISLKIWSS